MTRSSISSGLEQNHPFPVTVNNLETHVTSSSDRKWAESVCLVRLVIGQNTCQSNCFTRIFSFWKSRFTVRLLPLRVNSPQYCREERSPKRTNKAGNQQSKHREQPSHPSIHQPVNLSAPTAPSFLHFLIHFVVFFKCNSLISFILSTCFSLF